MKQIEILQKEYVENVRQVQVKKKKDLLGSMLPGDGHHLWEFDRKTKEMKKVKPVDTKTTEYKPKQKLPPGKVYIPHDAVHKEFVIRENCFYVYALNEKNAKKKIFQELKVPYVLVVEND